MMNNEVRMCGLCSFFQDEESEYSSSGWCKLKHMPKQMHESCKLFVVNKTVRAGQ